MSSIMFHAVLEFAYESEWCVHTYVCLSVCLSVLINNIIAVL